MTNIRPYIREISRIQIWPMPLITTGQSANHPTLLCNPFLSGFMLYMLRRGRCLELACSNQKTLRYQDIMLTNEDYNSLIQGISDLNFTVGSIPCKLLVTGDTAFPVLVTPTNQVLIAASKYGKGRIVVLSHESYLNEPQFTDFLRNAISWLKPSPEAVVGVVESLGLLANNLSTFGHNTELTAGFRKDFGVLCMAGYDDSQESEIVPFLREGGGLLIGAQAWYWSECYPELNVFHKFPGNKITSVAGVYFTNQKGDNGSFSVNKRLPPCSLFDEYDVDFSVDLKQLLNGVSSLDISGKSIASELLLHGPLTFPIGMTDSHQCFFAAAYYGRGRVVVGTHEGFLSKEELKPFILNAIKWLNGETHGRIGVRNDLKHLTSMLQGEGVSCASSNFSSEFHVYCCNSYSAGEVETIQQFVAEGGGLLIAGHAWYWSYSNPNVLSQYPGNKILNKFGISILSDTIKNGNYKVPDPELLPNSYHFLRAVCQLLSSLKNDEELRSPLTSWLVKLRQDLLSFFKLPASPLITSLWRELSDLSHGCHLPKVSKQHPVRNNSTESFILCLAHEVNCLYDSDENKTGTPDVQEKPPAEIQIDATNPGRQAWRSTGLYLPANKKATLVFPASVIGRGLQVQVGCQSDDLRSAEELCRPPVVIHRKKVDNEKVVISCVWGGLLYVIVNEKSQLGIIPVTVYGAEPAPTFIKGWMHAGYPIMGQTDSAYSSVSVTRMKKGMWGHIHELGHNQQRGAWEFPPHTTEATCNLWSVYVHETVLGIPRDKAHPALNPDVRENRMNTYLNNGAKLNEWSMWTALETYLQLQEGFGWDPFKRVFLDYQTMSNVSNDKTVKMNLWAEKFSQAVNKNLVPFFKAWGWPINDATSQKLSTLSEWEEDPMKKYVT
ncbi:TRPM8 channel-associated factor homolog isoform X2 [Hyla sarda]|uniref:TRPM8 channel-associated factor homolog isoform X2 n=1 Tax=Hyla sarda TaxID=327740 RepID=UPI0024C34332|nr:TRPM8 channel-associated factor homolog isoform X2 [Hyla sarda]